MRIELVRIEVEMSGVDTDSLAERDEAYRIARLFVHHRFPDAYVLAVNTWPYDRHIIQFQYQADLPEQE